jgi:hypothetical protein
MCFNWATLVGFLAQHFDREAQLRQRRPQVMGDHSKYDGSVGVSLRKAPTHLIERLRHGCNLERPIFFQRRYGTTKC